MLLKRSSNARSVMLLAAMAWVSGCQKSGPESRTQRCVAVTTSYLECAVTDLARGGVRVLRMLPPGGCPGHFDVTPGMIDKLRGSALLFRFDFQNPLDEKLTRLKDSGLTVIALSQCEGLCVPETYETGCQTICQALSRRWPDSADAYNARMAEVRRRLERLREVSRHRVQQAHLTGSKVLASEHQAAFCRWLGLEVVASLPRGEEARISQVLDSLHSAHAGHVKLVVANLQEGDRVARTFALRLGVPLVVFSNFPDMTGTQRTFDDLVRANVDALLAASGGATTARGEAPGGQS
jgi:zinc transport system substrate-binding protein